MFQRAEILILDDDTLLLKYTGVFLVLTIKTFNAEWKKDQLH